MFEFSLVTRVLVTILVSAVAALLFTPIIRAFAKKVGAVDTPKDERRMHSEPVPLLGGLAIILSYILTVLLFAEIDRQVQGMLLGGVIIAILGLVDDIFPLNAILKLCVQIVAACIAVYFGNVIEFITNPTPFGDSLYWNLGILSVPITIFWIVAITNAVNLIDGLDGLAVGVSAINAGSLLVIALLVAEQNVSILVAALLGACLGFIPYNLNPAKIFMGDTGATFLGYILAVISIQGLFKSYAIISFIVPFLILGLPIFDIASAFFRRVLSGQKPWHADRGHIHHKLIDMGFNQKQSVGILYIITAILGLAAVALTTSGGLKVIIFLAAIFLAIAVAVRIVSNNAQVTKPDTSVESENEDDKN